jgi:hypothetical protein
MISDITFPMVVYSIPSNGFVPATIIADNGSALIASYMKGEDIRPLILDFNTPESMRIISEKGKEGFKNHVIETLAELYTENGVRFAATKLYSNGFRDNMEIHRELKKRVPGLIVIAHGPHANWYGKEVLELYPDSVDIVSTGHGEVNATDLVKWAYGNGGLEEIPNIMFRGNPEVRKREYADLDTLPPPNYSKEVYPDIDDKILLPMLDGSRGCPYAKCIFCAQPPHMGPYRERKTSELLRDVEYLEKTLGISRSRLTDSSPKPERVNEFLSNLPKGHRTSFFGRSSTDYDFTLMDGRVAAMFIGFETVRNDTLRLYRKTDDPERYKRDFEGLVETCKELGIGTTVSMIVPSPWETDKTIQENVEYILDVNPDFCTGLPIGVLSKTILEGMVLRGDDVGIILDPDYTRAMMEAELNLLNLDIRFPYQVVVNGEYTNDILGYSKRFMLPLMEKGIFPASDENVTIADMHYGGLSRGQGERREQVLGFNKEFGDASNGMDYQKVRFMIGRTRAFG